MEKVTDSIVVYSTVWCPDCKRAKRFFGEQRVPYVSIDIERDAEAMALVEQVNQGKRVIPTIVFPDGSILVEPSNAQLAAKLGLKTKAQCDSPVARCDCRRRRSGGIDRRTARTRVAREGIDTLVIEQAGLGGQAGITYTLDNFPGFDEGISGAEFGDRLGRQARRFGVEILQAQSVLEISQDGQYLSVTTGDGAQHGTKAVLLATGARYRRMNIPGEEELIGVNIHFCATRDGAFYKGKKVLVVGGGNSGFEEGLFLLRFAAQVDIVQFAPEVKASQILQDKVAEKPNMTVTVNHAVQAFRGKNKLEAVIVQDRATGESKEWHYDGVFVFIGLARLSTTAVEYNRRIAAWSRARCSLIRMTLFSRTGL